MKNGKYVFAMKNPATGKLVLVDFRDYAKKVAEAYAARPSFESKYASSWKSLAEHCKKIFKQIQSKVTVEFVDEDPYTSAQEMIKEVKEKKILRIYKGHSDHPVWTPEENYIFRAVHDWYSHVLGAGAGGHAFDLRGEYNSYNRHVKLAPESARLALFTETVGQASYRQVMGSFPEQKICKLWGFDYINVGKIDDVLYQENFEKKEMKVAAKNRTNFEKKDLAMSELDKNLKSKIEKKINEIISRVTKGIFTDEYWQPIKKLVKEVSSIDMRLTPVLQAAQYKEYMSKDGNPRKEWVFKLDMPGADIGGWFLKCTASFGPSTLDKHGENLKDRYDLNCVLSWDGKMKHGDTALASTKKEKLEMSIQKMMNDKKFIEVIPEIMDAAKAGIAAEMLKGSAKNKKLIEFDQLSIDFLEAMKKKDEDAAMNAAMKLIDAGHGEAFDFEVNASLEEMGWSEEKLMAASEAIAKKCMSMHKGDSAWNPLCAEEIAKGLEHAMGYVNAVKLSQVVEAAWKDNKRDLPSLSMEIKDALSKMAMKSKI